MIGSAGAVVTNGLGAFIGDQNHLVTLGYGNQSAPVVIPPTTVVINVSGGGRVLSWEEAVLEEHKKRILEDRIRKYGSELKKVVKKIKKTEVQAKKADPVRVDGILANLWKLEERKEEIKLEVQTLRQEVIDIETMLIAANKLKDYEEDEEDIEFLLLQ